MTELIEKQKELKDLEKKRKDLFKKLKPIEKELDRLLSEIGKKKNEVGEILLKKEPLNWEVLLDADGGDVVYKKYCKELKNRGLISGCFIPETNQRCITVSLIKNDYTSFTKTISALKEILPFVKPMTSKNKKYEGYKYVDILENTLSENGTYYIFINKKENAFILMQDRYHYTYELKKFNSLEKLIEYVQKNHWYEI